MRDTGRQWGTIGTIRRDQWFARAAASSSPPWERECERAGARPYTPEVRAVDVAVAEMAESTCSASAGDAPCARWDGDPVVAWKEERRRRLRGDLVRRRFSEEMRGIELVGTSSAAAPPGSVRICAREIALGSAWMKI